MSRHGWYKFFSRREWAEAFLSGEVMFRSLSYFRDFEDRTTKQVIGDRYEGTATSMPDGGVILRARETGQVVKFVEPFAFNKVVDTENIYVYCVSNSYSDDLVREFNAVACIEMLDKRAFFDRLRPALPVGATFVSGRVEYYRAIADAEALKRLITSASPKDVVLSKLEQFRYQDEYRFAFSCTTALNDGSALRCLREFKPTANPDEHHEQLLALGDLRDISKLHLPC